MKTRPLLILLSMSLVGCTPPNEYQAPPPHAVDVAHPIQQTVMNYLEETGTTEAVEMVEIRARVSGYLEEINFQAGTEVEANAEKPLYVIQQAEYKANVASAEAEVAASIAANELATVERQRQQKLIKDKATSQSEADRSVANEKATAAAVDAAKAALARAKLDLAYTDVRSPISGRIGKTLVKLGNLVGESEATHLTTVISYDPIYVNFNISERALLLARKSTGKTAKRDQITDVKAYARRAIDDGFPFAGHLEYADLEIDQSTGTFMIRAIFDNPDMELVPGLFVRVRVELGKIDNAILIPERALSSDQAGRFVMVVDEQNVARRRNIEVGAKYEDMVVVLKGLSTEDVVVIDGLQFARPGAEIAPQMNQLQPVRGNLEIVEEGKNPPPPAEITAPELSDEATENGATTGPDASESDTPAVDTPDDAAGSDAAAARGGAPSATAADVNAASSSNVPATPAPSSQTPATLPPRETDPQAQDSRPRISMSRFFINRPIFAMVISIVIVIAGAVSQTSLPISKFPEITPPTVQVTAFYPGANAQVVAETVASPIEQEVNGVEDMIYMSSVSADDGSYTLTVTFEIGVDMDMATVLVQNRVAIANPKLPEDVRRQGITTKKQSTQIVQMITLTSEDPVHDELFLSNYATIHIKDQLSRIKGVGAVTIFGASDYSMRIWLDPNKLKARSLTTEDVLNAIREQNVQVAAGRIGEEPAPIGTAFQLVVNTQGRLTTDEQFSDIIIKTTEGGRIIRVRDVVIDDILDDAGKVIQEGVERGGKDYNRGSTFNGNPCTTIFIYQLPGANALDLGGSDSRDDGRVERQVSLGHETLDPVRYDAVRACLDRGSVRNPVYCHRPGRCGDLHLPAGLAFDHCPVRRHPRVADRHVRLHAALGFSINMLTLFGIVLAIGIVVDDAIVVVENTTRHLDTGLSPKKRP